MMCGYAIHFKNHFNSSPLELF